MILFYSRKAGFTCVTLELTFLNSKQNLFSQGLFGSLNMIFSVSVLKSDLNPRISERLSTLTLGSECDPLASLTNT